jgi:hypothetical protein
VDFSAGAFCWRGYKKVSGIFLVGREEAKEEMRLYIKVFGYLSALRGG